VARANRWGEPRDSVAPYPPIAHVLYVIKENRTYDEVLGDLPAGDGDSTLVFFPRAVTPNQHALAERFGIYDRFFVNAEVSADGHNWTTAAYATDYVQRSLPPWYSGRGRTYDYEGTNRGEDADHVPDDDVAAPANGYLWDLAERAGISFRNYGEFVVRRGKGDSARYIGTKPFLARTTSPRFAGFDLAIPDQRRADAWLAEFADDVRAGRMPTLEIVYLPNDHTAGTDPGACTPAACVADNDLALGRIVEALSRSPFWRSTAVFVVEDDAQNGPDHVDSHRAPFLVISPWARPGVQHRWTNTTDVVATIAELLHLGHLSQFDYYGRPLRDAFGDSANLAPYTAARPAVDLTARNPARGVGSAESRRLDLSREDRVDDEQFNRLLWRAIKGRQPYPGPTRASALEWRRSR
ncbi:MAG TPA: alkaline phosphatase family protein, partial [Gemmatimonadaceae bacterium]|nr:alkaline phosphatase family protein [Gemmatimonadaceae bacterium]